MAIAKRKKRFFDVEMPAINKETQLQAFEIKELDGRFIKYDLTRILRGKSILLQFEVSVNEDKATARPRELKIMPYFLKKVVRKGTDYVENSFITKCKDAEVEIKPFAVTRRRVSRAVRKALREMTKDEIIKYLKTKTRDQIFDDLLKNKLQRELSLKLKKIYPLSLCEIKTFKVLKQLEVEKKEEVKEKVPEEVEEPAPKGVHQGGARTSARPRDISPEISTRGKEKEIKEEEKKEEDKEKASELENESVKNE